MKEMLSNLADGQIEFYKAVCKLSPLQTGILILRRLGNGGVGANHTCYPAYTGGRLGHSSLRIVFLYPVVYRRCISLI